MSQEVLLDALNFAAIAHKDQSRKGNGGAPYINHLIETCSLLTNVAKVTDTNVLVAAVLHDCLEDTDVTELDILTRFGQTVLDYVKAVTDDKSLSLDVRRKKQLDSLKTAGKAVMLIKLADHCSNIASLPESWGYERLRSYLHWSNEISTLCLNSSRELSDEYSARYEKAQLFIKARKPNTSQRKPDA